MADNVKKGAPDKEVQTPVEFHAAANAPYTVVTDDKKPEVKPEEVELKTPEGEKIVASNTVTDADHRQENPASREEQESLLRHLGVYAPLDEK